MSAPGAADRVAVAFAGRTYGRSQLDALAGGLAATLHRRGVREGQRVALMSSNRPEFVAAVLAISPQPPPSGGVAGAAPVRPGWRSTSTSTTS